jgi:hypothetical protein
MLQLETSCSEKGKVMSGVKGLMGRRPVRVRFRDKIESLLKGQVILSI